MYLNCNQRDYFVNPVALHLCHHRWTSCYLSDYRHYDEIAFRATALLQYRHRFLIHNDVHVRCADHSRTYRLCCDLITVHALRSCAINAHVITNFIIFAIMIATQTNCNLGVQ